MSLSGFSAAPASVGGEALWRTNPVLCIDRLLDQWDRSDASWVAGAGRLRNLLSTLRERGIRLPREAFERWAAAGHISSDYAPAAAEPPAPRVVGLAVDGASATGYVFPLPPTPAGNGWRIDPHLPFTPDQVQDVLAGLLAVSGVPDPRAVPERLAYDFENPTQMAARGDSMTVAAVLSVLDHLGGRASPSLRAAIALVEPLPGERLRSVSAIPLKLAAARREYGSLSLIVCHPGVKFERREEEVWEVDTLADLAGRLHSAGLLSPLLDAVGPLTRPEATQVLDRLRRQVLQEKRYRDASDLGDRVRRCGFADPAEPAVQMEFAHLQAMTYRHHGRFADAVAAGREAYEKVANLGELGCDDEEANAAAEYSACLFSGHRFAEIPRILQPWAEAAANEPRRFRPMTRVKVWNTLGRALAVLKRDGWDELFGRSLSLHHWLDDRENVDRTAHYRVHALLRHGDRTAARRVLEGTPGPAERLMSGDPWPAFLYANLARLEDRGWTDPVLEGQIAAGPTPYSAWLYVQATARQSPRRLEDTVFRLELAVGFLRHEADRVHGNVCNLFASFLGLSLAARRGDARRWGAALDEIHRFLSSAPDHRDYYGPTVEALPGVPTLAGSEALLERVPYF